jgi:hypothetical protein
MGKKSTYVRVQWKIQTSNLPTTFNFLWFNNS